MAKPREDRRQQILAAAFRVAARERLDGLTVRRVAAEAGLSPGLVFFYFKTKDALLVELLDWLLAKTIVPKVDDEILAMAQPGRRFVARLRKAVEQVARERIQVELFFDYWVMGTRHPEVREKIRASLVRYREMFRPLIEDFLREDPEALPGGSPEGLAGVAVSFVEGCAVQAIIDPEHFDVEEFMTSVKALLSRQVVAPGARG